MKRRLDQLNSDLTAKQSTLETLKKYLEQEHGYYFELDHYIDQCYSQQVSLYRKRASCRSVNILIKFVLLRMLIKIQHIFYCLEGFLIQGAVHLWVVPLILFATIIPRASLRYLHLPSNRIHCSSIEWCFPREIVVGMDLSAL